MCKTMSDTRPAEQVREFNSPDVEVLTSTRQTGGRCYAKVVMCSCASFPLTIYQVMTSSVIRKHTHKLTHKRPLTWRHSVDIVWSCLSCVVQSEKEANGDSPSNYWGSSRGLILLTNVRYFFFYHGATTEVVQGLLIIEDSWSHSHTPHSVGHHWTSDQLDAETSTWQHTTLAKERHPCP